MDRTSVKPAVLFGLSARQPSIFTSGFPRVGGDCVLSAGQSECEHAGSKRLAGSRWSVGSGNSLTLKIKYDKVTTMRESITFTVSLPPAMAKEIARAMKAEHRTRSELVREALRVYLSARLIPSELLTAAEARAYRRGMAAYRRGDSITLPEFVNGMDRGPRRSRKKVS